jgi:hypothetical protein
MLPRTPVSSRPSSINSRIFYEDPAIQENGNTRDRGMTGDHITTASSLSVVGSLLRSVYSSEGQSDDTTTEQPAIFSQVQLAQSTDVVRDDNVQASAPTCADHQEMWNPFWLKKVWLIAYATLFGTLAVAILALYFTSIRMNGLGASKGTKEMANLWKFCPTASTCCVTPTRLFC